jgi:hypothetical protein
VSKMRLIDSDALRAAIIRLGILNDIRKKGNTDDR